MIVTQKDVRERTKAMGLKVSREFIDDMSLRSMALVERAMERAKDNGRKVLLARDL